MWFSALIASLMVAEAPGPRIKGVGDMNWCCEQSYCDKSPWWPIIVALLSGDDKEYWRPSKAPKMLREHQSIVGTATAQLPEMLIPHRRKKVRRIPKVCSSGDSSRAQVEMRSRLNFYVLTWLNLSEGFVFSFAVQKLKRKQQHFLANRVFPFYPFLSAVIYCLIYPHLYIFLFPQRRSVTSAPKSLRCWRESLDDVSRLLL